MQIPHPGNLEKTRRDESVPPSWEDGRSKTLNKNMEHFGGEGSLEPPYLGGPSFHQVDPVACGDLDGRDTMNMGNRVMGM